MFTEVSQKTTKIKTNLNTNSTSITLDSAWTIVRSRGLPLRLILIAPSQPITDLTKWLWIFKRTIVIIFYRNTTQSKRLKKRFIMIIIPKLILSIFRKFQRGNLTRVCLIEFNGAKIQTVWPLLWARLCRLKPKKLLILFCNHQSNKITKTWMISLSSRIPISKRI